MGLRLAMAFCLAALTVGCGGASAGRADVEPESMPPGGTFTGVWSSPQYGEMQLVQTGSHVVGRYQKNERVGRIQGTVQGDLLRFQWEEKREMVQGRPTITRGRGYFKYEIGDDGRHYAIGEWGIDNSEVGGGPWRAYKLKGREPTIDTAGGDEAPGSSDDGFDDAPPPAEEAGTTGEPAPADDTLEGLDEF